MTDDDQTRLIRDVYEAKQEYFRLRYGLDARQQLGPPATEAELRALGELLGRPLPSSYAGLLMHHRSWSNLIGDAGILSLEDRGSPLLRKPLASLPVFRQEVGDHPEWVFIVAAGETSDYFVFLDPDSIRPDGEMDVVEYSTSAGDLGRHSDFWSFLRGQLDWLHEQLAEETLPEEGIRR